MTQTTKTSDDELVAEVEKALNDGFFPRGTRIMTVRDLEFPFKGVRHIPAGSMGIVTDHTVKNDVHVIFDIDARGGGEMHKTVPPNSIEWVR